MKRARHRRWAVALGAAAVGLASGRADALQDFIPYTGGVYSQDFNTLPTSNGVSGGSPPYVDGGAPTPYRVPSQPDRSNMTNMVYNYLDAWEFVNNVGTAVRFNVDTGTNIVGSTYSYGDTIVPSDRALGALSSGSQEPFFGFNLRNDTGATITQITLSYRGEQYRQNGAGTLAFSYVIQSVLSGYDVSLGGTTAPVLDFVAPKTGVAGALDGNAAGNYSNVSAPLSGLSWGPGQYLWLRWNKAGVNSPGLAIDDVSFATVTPNAVGTVPVALIVDNAPGAGGGRLSSFGGTSGLTAFYAGLTGTSDGSTAGLFRGDGTTLVAIAREKQAAPGGGTFTSFSIPAMNATGQVAFFASTTTTGGVFRGDGTTIASIARVNGAAPGGSTYSTLFNPSIGPTGQVAFFAFLGDGSAGLFRGDGTTNASIARDNQAVPNGGNISPGGFNITNPAVNSAGQVAFYTTLANTTANFGIYRGVGGALTQIARDGQTAPGAGGGTFNNITSNVMINDSGQVGFFANVTNTTDGSSRGVFRGDGAALTQIARDLQAAPGAGGGMIQILYPDPQINNLGQVAFAADISGSASMDGIFRGSGGALTAIARHNQAAPGGGTFAPFINLLGATPAFALAPGGQVAFNADLNTTEGSSADEGVFESDGQDLIKVVRRADLIAGEPVVDIQRIAADAINQYGQVSYQASLGKGTVGFYLFTPTLHWRGTMGGNWDDSTNWTLSLAPALVHDVFIDPATSQSVNGPAGAVTVKNLTIGGGAGSATLLNNTGALTVANTMTVQANGTYSGAGSLTASTIINHGSFTQTGPSVHHGVFFNESGNATLGGTQTWDTFMQVVADGGAVTITSDVGSESAYHVGVYAGPASGSSTIHLASHAGDQFHLNDLGVNDVGMGGNGLVIIDAATHGDAPNPKTHFGAIGGSVAVYIGDANGGTTGPVRISLENLWRSAALEGYWALQNHLVTAVVRGITLGPGIVTDPSKNGLIVIPSVDNANHTVTYVGEDIIGDSNGDGKVDINDLGNVLQHLNTTPGSLAGEAGYTIYTPHEGDVNGDLLVNINDLGAVLGHLGQTYSPAASVADPGPVPEPASGTLLALAAATLLRRRRRS